MKVQKLVGQCHFFKQLQQKEGVKLPTQLLCPCNKSLWRMVCFDRTYERYLWKSPDFFLVILSRGRLKGKSIRRAEQKCPCMGWKIAIEGADSTDSVSSIPGTNTGSESRSRLNMSHFFRRCPPLWYEGYPYITSGRIVSQLSTLYIPICTTILFEKE